MKQKIELVIFDWDGTLFDSVGQIVASLQYAAQQFEQPLTDEAAKSIIGLGLPEVMQILFPQVPHLHQDLLQCYADHYVANSKGDVWFNGVAELLMDLKQQGLKLAVATGKSRKGLDRVLAQTNSHALFDITRAASETKSKPDPLMLQEILAEMDVAAERAIMVGDTSYDLEMAQNLNMPRIGVSYGVHSIETLQQYQPLTIAHRVQDLHHYLQSLLKVADVTES
ncbi:HAD-IA family hydrolase [Acinetobacter sp. 1000160]|uniref:HAD-IA family hydrolase n=1 Tax=Acinetobacter sp. 1000160 TaxID=1310800 RepID=UPI00044B674C|nr:HAD-IA family hydrolase [Acinetobacter sp. 1000160]EXB45917.1 HAD hydrolase, IA, variant 1 family protein [Acinetobacter baumannii 146457]EYT18700.1 HAD hydrolase, IA, variant 1 family protein [Acinetobacter sp. 1000160]